MLKQLLFLSSECLERFVFVAVLHSLFYYIPPPPPAEYSESMSIPIGLNLIIILSTTLTGRPDCIP